MGASRENAGYDFRRFSEYATPCASENISQIEGWVALVFLCSFRWG